MFLVLRLQNNGVAQTYLFTDSRKKAEQRFLAEAKQVIEDVGDEPLSEDDIENILANGYYDSDNSTDSIVYLDLSNTDTE